MDKYNWLERARAYDDYLERKKREEKEKAILEMAERHARLAMAFQQRVAERLREINPSELSPSDMAKWLDVATKLERLSRGEPTEIGKRDNVNLTTDKDGFRIEVEYVDGRSDGRTERNDKE